MYNIYNIYAYIFILYICLYINKMNDSNGTMKKKNYLQPTVTVAGITVIVVVAVTIRSR